MNLPTRVARVERGRVRAGLQAPLRRRYFDRRSDERQVSERVLGLQVDAAARERDRDGALRAVLGVDAERRADAPQPRLVGRRRAEPEPLAAVIREDVAPDQRVGLGGAAAHPRKISHGRGIGHRRRKVPVQRDEAGQRERVGALGTSVPHVGWRPK